MPLLPYALPFQLSLLPYEPTFMPLNGHHGLFHQNHNLLPLKKCLEVDYLGYQVEGRLNNQSHTSLQSPPWRVILLDWVTPPSYHPPCSLTYRHK